MTTTTNGHNKAIAVGEAALSGWRGSVGRAIAKPVAKRTRFTVQQVEAAIGLAMLAYATYRMARPLIAAARSEV
jgi:copper oxidase (laccase) domain-containing protein